MKEDFPADTGELGHQEEMQFSQDIWPKFGEELFAAWVITNKLKNESIVVLHGMSKFIHFLKLITTISEQQYPPY